jgi:hypothetical protein
VSTSQRWAGWIAGLAIGLTTVGSAAAQAPQGLAPDPSPAPATHHLVPDAAPGAAVKAAPRSAPATARVHAARAPSGQSRPTAPPAHRPTEAAAPHAVRPRPAAPSPATHLRLGAVRRTLAGLKPVSPRAHPPGTSQRLLFTLAGGTLLLLAATGTATLARTTSKERA